MPDRSLREALEQIIDRNECVTEHYTASTDVSVAELRRVLAEHPEPAGLVVTDGAAEAAARRYYGQEGWDWGEISQSGKEILIAEFRAALEAAVPFLQGRSEAGSGKGTAGTGTAPDAATEAPTPLPTDFTGHEPRECGEHRPGLGRAWCFDCSEWCYPHAPCVRCELPTLRAKADAEPSALDLVRELREALGLFSGAMPVTPKHAWDEALTQVTRLKAASSPSPLALHRERLIDALRPLLLAQADCIEHNAIEYRDSKAWRTGESAREKGRNKRIGHQVASQLSTAQHMRSRAEQFAGELADAVLATTKAIDLGDNAVVDRIAQAIGDPGSFLPRGDNYQETITRWSTRAVLTVLRDLAGGER